jgi:hypothetical protein
MTTSKERVQRIEPYYFRRRTRLDYLKISVTLLALAAVGGWLVAQWSDPQRAAALYSPGPVASVHAAWDHHCQACHGGQPVNSNTAWLGDLVHGNRDWRANATQRCEVCHAAPAHHRDVRPESVVSCGGCHRDHQGRNHSLVRLRDSDCTSCHGNLIAHYQPGVVESPRYANRITAFAVDHPEIKALAQQQAKPIERTIKFSHAIHMLPGMFPVGSKRVWTLGDIEQISPAQAARYRTRQPEDQRDPASPVILSCASCHETDSGLVGLEVPAGLGGVPRSLQWPARAAGAYMLPISFEKHCQACHPNVFDASRRETPHRVQPAKLRESLEQFFLSDLVRGNPRLLQSVARPGRLDRPEEATSELASLGEQLKTLTDQAHARLLPGTASAGCLKCHYRQDDQIKPVTIPEVWFPAAKFNHAAHRAMDCAECHPGTGAPPGGKLEAFGPELEREPLHMVGIAQCKTCHAPAQVTPTGPVGGVRHACTDCHSYHHGDYPLQGRGASQHAPAKRLTAQQLIAGQP